MATHSSILAWRIPTDRGANGVTESQDATERLSLSLKSLSPFALLYTLHHHPHVELFPSFQANITYEFQQLSIPLPQRLAPTVPLYINISAVETSKHRT